MGVDQKHSANSTAKVVLFPLAESYQMLNRLTHDQNTKLHIRSINEQIKTWEWKCQHRSNRIKAVYLPNLKCPSLPRPPLLSVHYVQNSDLSQLCWVIHSPVESWLNQPGFVPRDRLCISWSSNPSPQTCSSYYTLPTLPTLRLDALTRHSTIQ